MSTTSTIQERERAIIDEFALFDDWMGKYEYLIELGNSLPLIEDDYKTDDYKIKGCQSQVWLRSEYRDGRVFYKADSDALITKGLIALLIRVVSDQTPEQIAEAELSFLDVIGLKEHLSPTRKNGLSSMVKQMKLYALAHREAMRNGQTA